MAGIPYCGKDGKTGQTWIKSVLAPAFRARALRVTGWYSANLLGNEDGRGVGDPQRESRRSSLSPSFLPIFSVTIRITTCRSN